MRQLVWLLLLANLGMLAWLLTQPEPQTARYRPVPVPPGIEPLVLLSERSVKTAGSKPAAADAAGAVSPDDQQASGSAGQASQGGALREAAGTESTAVAAQEIVTPEPEAAQEAEAAPEPRPEPVCQAVGPFMQEADAEAISQKLSATGYPSNLRTGEVRNPAGYWVYLPAMPRAEARRIVAELDDHGMTDYYIGKQNYISLGIFSGKEKAQVRLEQIKRLGFDPVLDRRFRTRTVYWVDIVQGEVPLLGSPIWSDIQAQHTEIRVQRISCE